jgi:hypothetical protein
VEAATAPNPSEDPEYRHDLEDDDAFTQSLDGLSEEQVAARLLEQREYLQGRINKLRQELFGAQQ